MFNVEFAQKVPNETENKMQLEPFELGCLAPTLKQGWRGSGQPQQFAAMQEPSGNATGCCILFSATGTANKVLHTFLLAMSVLQFSRPHETS